MSRQAHNDWIVLSPPHPGQSDANQQFREHAELLSECIKSDIDNEKFEDAIQASLNVNTQGRPIALHAALCILSDLARQRWSIRLNDSGDVEVKRPVEDRVDPIGEKARIRAQELVKRDEQLREPSTRRFVQGMEKTSIHEGRFVSIFSIIQDGRDLAEELKNIVSLPEEEQTDALSNVIRPYLQFVDETHRCEHTGLRLQDIWRYFRHTWTNQYTSTPGRSMAFLVRDRARKNHPVIGIGALGSPIVQIRERDSWIGWNPESFLEIVTESPSAEIGIWLQKTVDEAIEEIYVDDFYEEELLSPNDLRRPTPEVIKILINHGKNQKDLHYRLAKPQHLERSDKQAKNNHRKFDWQARARTHLYRSKRASSLADMLRSRTVLQRYLSSPPTLKEVRDLIATREGQRVVKNILRKAKADRVGISMADITVCGAVAPYNHILGGKLVSMLAVSPQVVKAYRDKYAERESEIASSMAGRPIIRPADLVFFGTTSLYGIGSSQYNRLKMPAKRLGSEEGEKLAFIEIGKSEAYGTSHFSSDTVHALVSLVQQSTNGRRVNSIFGEGVSPKLRKVRGGLDKLSLPADALLQHGRQRIVYGVPVVRNLREYLLGMENTPDYIFDFDDVKRGTEEIGRWWIERWVQNRIKSEAVLAQVEKHTLIQPIRHGARVNLPSVDDDQGALFDDLIS